MQTVVIDGKEYLLVPKETVATPTAISNGPQPSQNDQERAGSIIDDFLIGNDEIKPVDDGLATQKEKESAIRVTEQTVISASIPSVPKAQPKKYEYRERFVKHELMPSDIMTFPRIGRDLLANNPEDPMIKADAKKPKGNQLFYGPGNEVEGY